MSDNSSARILIKVTEEQRKVLADVLAKTVAYQPAFRKITGSTKAALLLSQLWYWRDKGTIDPNGWFYKVQSELKAETGLTRQEQETARKILSEKGFIVFERRGQPARLWWYVYEGAIVDALLEANGHHRRKFQIAETSQSRLRESSKLVCGDSANKNAGTLQTGLREPSKQECGNPAIKNAGIQQSITENTSQSTAESTSQSTAEISQERLAGEYMSEKFGGANFSAGSIAARSVDSQNLSTDSFESPPFEKEKSFSKGKDFPQGVDATAGATVVPDWARDLKEALIWREYSKDTLRNRLGIVWTEPEIVKIEGFEYDENNPFTRNSVFYFTGYPEFVQVEGISNTDYSWNSVYVLKQVAGQYQRLKTLCENVEGDDGYDIAYQLAEDTAVSIIKNYESGDAKVEPSQASDKSEISVTEGKDSPQVKDEAAGAVSTVTVDLGCNTALARAATTTACATSDSLDAGSAAGRPAQENAPQRTTSATAQESREESLIRNYSQHIGCEPTPEQRERIIAEVEHEIRWLLHVTTAGMKKLTDFEEIMQLWHERVARAA
jgi:hypothetical protein